MRALVISDIHGNIDALRAIELQWDRGLHEFERVICLGDLVDYGPDPSAVVEGGDGSARPRASAAA